MKGTDQRDELYNLQFIRFWVNFIGLALNGAGTLLLAYIVFTSNWSKEDKEMAKTVHDATWAADFKIVAHEIGTSDKNKWSIILIFLGVLLQMSAILI